jgi:hypothetical protein
MPDYPVVRFHTDFFKPVPGEDEVTNPGIYGVELSNWLVEKLAERGVDANILCAEDWGWLIIVEDQESFSLDLECHGEYGRGDLDVENILDNDVRGIEWSVAISVETHIFKCLFKHVDPMPEVRKLEQHLKDLVPTLPGVFNIEWEATTL